MNKLINYQPEHFPQGTIVEIKNPFHQPIQPFFQIEVKSLCRQHGTQDLILESTEYDEITGVYKAWNVSHTSKIIARGAGKVVMENLNYPSPRDLPVIKKGCYETRVCKQLLTPVLWFIRKLDPDYSSGRHGESLDTDLIFSDIRKQTFCKKVVQTCWPGENYPPIYHTNKKRLERFVRKNWRRWLMSRKAIDQVIENYRVMENTYYTEQAHEA